MKSMNFFVLLAKRVLELMLKFVSIKVIAAIVVTYVATRSPSGVGIVMTTLMWITVVGARAYEKAAGVIKLFGVGVPSSTSMSDGAKAGEP